MRAARREREAFDLGRSRRVPVWMVFMAQGRRAGGISEAIRQRPKGLSEARREVRALVVVRKRRESGVTCAVERRAREEPKGISFGAKGGHKEGAKRSMSR